MDSYGYYGHGSTRQSFVDREEELRRQAAMTDSEKREERKRKRLALNITSQAEIILSKVGSEDVSDIKKHYLSELAPSDRSGGVYAANMKHFQIYFQNANQHDIKYFPDIIRLIAARNVVDAQDFIIDFLQTKEGDNIPMEVLLELSRAKYYYGAYMPYFNMAELLEVWLEKTEDNNLPFEQLIKMIDLEFYEEVRSKAIKCWLKKDENTLTIDMVLQYTSAERPELAMLWMTNNQVDFETFRKIAEKTTLTFQVFSQFLKKNNCDLEQLKIILENQSKSFLQGSNALALKTRASSIVMLWAQQKTLSLQDIETLNPYLTNPEKIELYLCWIAQDPNNKFEEVLKFIDPEHRLDFLDKYINSLPDDEVAVGDSLSALEAPYKNKRSEFISTRLPPLLEQFDNIDASKVAVKYLSNSQQNNFPITLLHALILKNNEASATRNQKFHANKVLVDTWLERNVDIAIKEFQAILSNVNDSFLSGQFAQNLLDRRLKLIPLDQKQQRYDTFVQIAKEGSLSKDFDSIVPNVLALIEQERVIDFCNDIYTNNRDEIYNFALEYIRKADPIKQYIVAIAALIQPFKDDDKAMTKVLPLIASKMKRQDQATAFKLVKDIMPSKYKPLEGKKIKDCVSAINLDGLSNYFKMPVGEESLASYLSYCVMNDDLTYEYVRRNFFDILNPEAALEAKKLVHSIKYNHYLRPEEYHNICKQWGSAIDIAFPKVEAISKYLEPKVQIKDLGPIQNYQISFSEEFKKASPAAQESLNERFRQFLDNSFLDTTARSPIMVRGEPQQYNPKTFILQLFSELFQLPASEDLHTSLSNVARPGSPDDLSEQDRFYHFCYNNKKMLGNLFMQPNILSQFTADFIKDGCGVNIASQGNIILARNLLKNPCDQVLFSYFNKILADIAKTDGGDVLGLQPNLFKHSAVNNCLLCPVSFFEELQKEFYNNLRPEGNKIERSSWEFLSSLEIIKVSEKDIAAQEKIQAIRRANARSDARVEARANTRARIRGEARNAKEESGEVINEEVWNTALSAEEDAATEAENSGKFNEADLAEEKAELAREAANKDKFKAAAKATIVKNKWLEILGDSQDLEAEAAKMAAYLVLNGTMPEFFKCSGLKQTKVECGATLDKVKKVKLEPEVAPSSMVATSAAKRVAPKNPKSTACVVM